MICLRATDKFAFVSTWTIGAASLGSVQLRAQVSLVTRPQRRRHGLACLRLVCLRQQAPQPGRRAAAKRTGGRVNHNDGAEGRPRAEGGMDGQLRLCVVVAEAARQRSSCRGRGGACGSRR